MTGFLLAKKNHKINNKINKIFIARKIMRKNIFIFLLIVVYSFPVLAAEDGSLLSLFAGTEAEKTFEDAAQEEENGGFFSFLNFKKQEVKKAEINVADKERLTPLEQTIKLADNGDVNSQLLLGYSYLYGENGAGVNYDKSFEYYAKAALQNNPIGLNNLGSLYYSGIGIKRNSLKAAILFEKSANLGNADAAVNLGFILISGNGHTINPKLAMDYFEMAAKANNPIAQYMLGYAHYKGKLRAKDYKRAAKLFKNAADAGIDGAQFMTAQMYMNGIGVPQNYGNAVKYLKQSVAQGNGQSMMLLGEILAKGDKYKKDAYYAHVLFNLAAVRDMRGASEQRASVESKLKMEELLMAQTEAEKYEARPTNSTQYIQNTFGYDITSYIDNTK